MITVVLVDDHPIVRAGIRQVVEADGDVEVIAEAGDGAEAVTVVRRTRPDVVLMDLRMPDLDGVSATQRLRADLPDTQVLVLTTYDTDDLIVQAVEAGAVGYLLKDTEPDDLRGAIRRAAAGETVLSPPVAARLVQRLRAPDPTTLTPRELEILGQVAEGRTNAEIAEALHVGRATVKTHLLHIFDKLGVNDRTAAVATAFRRGILTPPSPER
ncbi:MAG: response regulator transcription factor [Actinomycetota bacterium]